jgi:hypothetical protein
MFFSFIYQVDFHDVLEDISGFLDWNIGIHVSHV